MRFLYFSFFFFSLLSCELYSQRGLVADDVPDTTQIGNYYILPIGVDSYENWRDLDNAVNDATGISGILREKYRFSEIVAPLYDAKASRQNILSTIRDSLPQLLSEDDNLIIFFAGHGYTETRKVGRRDKKYGYLIPADAKSPTDKTAYNSYLRIDRLLEDISALPNRHITVILDACYSGFALSEDISKYRSGSRFMNVLLKNQSRKVIVSAREDQLASDSGPLPGNSLFTGELIMGLKNGSLNKDEYPWIHFGEMALAIQSRVSDKMGELQTPDFGSFYEDERGEMILIPENVEALEAITNLDVSYTASRGPIVIGAQNDWVTYGTAAVGVGTLALGTIVRSKANGDYDNYLSSIDITNSSTVGETNPLYTNANSKYKTGQYLQIAGGLITSAATYFIIKKLRSRRLNKN